MQSTRAGDSVAAAASPVQAQSAPIVDDEQFMDNVREALDNGCEAVCAYCGTGLAGDGLDMHERACPYPEQAR